MVAVSAKLVGEVVEGTPGGGEGCGHTGAAEAIERLDLELLFEGVEGLVGEKGVRVVGKAVAKIAKFFGLVFRNQEFGG